MPKHVISTSIIPEFYTIAQWYNSNRRVQNCNIVYLSLNLTSCSDQGRLKFRASRLNSFLIPYLFTIFSHLPIIWTENKRIWNFIRPKFHSLRTFFRVRFYINLSFYQKEITCSPKLRRASISTILWHFDVRDLLYPNGPKYTDWPTFVIIWWW